MEVITQILGNIYHEPEWKRRAEDCNIENVVLDQWTAQKSRFLAKGDKGNVFPIALARHSQVSAGDVILFAPLEHRMVVVQVELSQVMVIDMGRLIDMDSNTMIHTAVELGHALGNQHWPAVIKGTKVYVPLTVDKKVMTSVMDTHHFESIIFEFVPGTEIIPYLAPHEIRRLFGGSSHESLAHPHYHSHDYNHHEHQ